jgi:hypothetical protein
MRSTAIHSRQWPDSTRVVVFGQKEVVNRVGTAALRRAQGRLCPTPLTSGVEGGSRPVDRATLKPSTLACLSSGSVPPTDLVEDLVNSQFASSPTLASAGGWKVIFQFGNGVFALDGNGKSRTRL